MKTNIRQPKYDGFLSASPRELLELAYTIAHIRCTLLATFSRLKPWRTPVSKRPRLAVKELVSGFGRHCPESNGRWSGALLQRYGNISEINWLYSFGKFGKRIPHRLNRPLKKSQKQIRCGRLTTLKAASATTSWKGMALAVPKVCCLGKGSSPSKPRLKPFLMEFDFAGLKPGASTGSYGARERAPLQNRVEPRLFQAAREAGS